MSETKEKPERSNAADVAESLLLALDAGPNKPSLPVLEAMLAEARRELAHEAYGAASMLADGVMDDADWELFDLADEVRGAAVELLRALDGEA